jgi:glucokinase
VEAGDLLIAPAQAALGRNLTARTHRPNIPVLPAALGNEAGMIGAADLARGGS